MPDESGDHTELTPEALDVLKNIQDETERLRQIDLAETPPAAVFMLIDP